VLLHQGSLRLWIKAAAGFPSSASDSLLARYASGVDLARPGSARCALRKSAAGPGATPTNWPRIESVLPGKAHCDLWATGLRSERRRRHEAGVLERQQKSETLEARTREAGGRLEEDNRRVEWPARSFDNLSSSANALHRLGQPEP